MLKLQLWKHSAPRTWVISLKVFQSHSYYGIVVTTIVASAMRWLHVSGVLISALGVMWLARHAKKISLSVLRGFILGKR